MRDLDDKIEADKFHSDGESEDNLHLVLLFDLELESSDNSDTEEVISVPKETLEYGTKKRCRICCGNELGADH